MRTHRLQINTGHQRNILDLSGEVNSFLKGTSDGLVNILVPHATAGLAIMELGSGSEADLWDRLDFLLPREDRYRHSHGSKGHGADHIVPAFLAPTLTLPVISGRVLLGTWQSIALVDPNVDNPHREVLLAFLSSQ